MLFEKKYFIESFSVYIRWIFMQISEVSLQGFRNLEKLHIEPSAGINVSFSNILNIKRDQLKRALSRYKHNQLDLTF